MKHLLDSFETVFPLLLYMMVGVGIKKTKILNSSSMKELNNLVFKVFLPISIFNNIYAANSGETKSGPVIFYASIFTLFIFSFFWLFFETFEKKRDRRGVMIQNAFRSNFVLFGISLSQMLLDDSISSSSVTGVLIAVMIPLFNALAVIVLQYYGKEKTNLLLTINGILRNPLIIAAIFAIAIKNMGINTPSWLNIPLLSMGRVATPLALIILGGQFNFHHSKDFIPQLLIGIGSRLVFVPFLALSGAILIGFRGEVLIALLALFASPAAVSSFTMTQQIGGDHELAGQLLVYTTMLCSLTLFVFIFLLKQFSFI